VKIYAFPHRTFQEYLAACYLTDEDYPDKLVDLIRENQERWREVWLLAAAKMALGSMTVTWQLAQTLCNTAPQKRAAKADCWAAHFAALAIVESAEPGNVPPSQKRFHGELRKWLVNIISRENFPAIERALAGQSLAALGDPRLEVMTLENMQFCLIPGGRFWQGKAEGDKNFFSAGEPAGWNLDLKKSFWMARFPLTNAQFQFFIDSLGYDNPDYWPEAIELGEWKDARYRETEWNSKDRKWVTTRSWRNKPLRYISPFSLLNHPVVGISWHEALAFCRWATQTARENNWIGHGWEFRLPTEAEWEKASRGGKQLFSTKKTIIKHLNALQTDIEDLKYAENSHPQRIFPWGDKIDSNKCSYLETGLHAPSTVGCFPGGKSPYGCEEMSGTVWEWCLTKWRNDYKETEDNNLSGSAFRVIRGGAYFHYARYLRCSYRRGLNPQRVRDNLGFRLCLAPTNKT